MQTVTALLRYPLKSARGEALEAVDVEPGGLRDDRTWACIDRADGTVGSAKHPARWGRLLDVGTRAAGPGGRFVDFGAVHILTTGALSGLARRCVVPGLGRAELPPDRSLLCTLARHYRVAVPGLGAAACFGTYAEVVRPGRIGLGQPVR